MKQKNKEVVNVCWVLLSSILITFLVLLGLSKFADWIDNGDEFCDEKLGRDSYGHLPMIPKIGSAVECYYEWYDEEEYRHQESQIFSPKEYRLWRESR